jgi:hypothetical protein
MLHRPIFLRGIMAAVLVSGTWLAPLLSPGQQRPPSDATQAAAAEPDGYYHGGALAGSLRSTGPLALYHSDPDHLWNLLFAALYVRPSELPGRPPYPEDRQAPAVKE